MRHSTESPPGCKPQSRKSASTSVALPRTTTSPLTPAEKTLRVAALRRLLRAPAFQVLVRDAEHGRDQS